MGGHLQAFRSVSLVSKALIIVLVANLNLTELVIPHTNRSKNKGKCPVIWKTDLLVMHEVAAIIHISHHGAKKNVDTKQ